MIKELEKVSEIFLSDADPEYYEDNKELLKEWEKGLEENRLMLSWQAHDITKEIVVKVREAYKEFAVQLATNRTLTEEQRQSMYCKQDACLFIIKLADTNALEQVKEILKQIEIAVARTT